MATPLIVEELLEAQPEAVWKAISNRDEMSLWYFDLKEFKAEKGFSFQFEGGPSEDRMYTHLCTVLEAIPDEKLSYSWKYKGYEGSSTVSFELFPQENGTLIRLTHSGLETFPTDNPDLARGNFEAGWTEIIHTLLPEYLQSLNF